MLTMLAESLAMERKWKGGPADRKRRIVDALARCFVLQTDRVVYDRKMFVSCRSIIPHLDPVTDPESQWWPWIFRQKYPFGVTPVMEARRKEVLQRIAQGSLGIEDRMGVWKGSFWHGLRLSGAIRQGTGTEFRIWERAHPKLVADLAEMPLTKRLEPKATKRGQRRLRRCYAALLPPEDPTGAAALAGLFAGAVLLDAGGESWLELPAHDGVKGLLTDWGMPFVALERTKGGPVVRVSPLFAMLVAHLMPPHSAVRISGIWKAGGCPRLSAILWQMVLARRNRRYMPFPDALPFGCSKATFFRRDWRRRDLHKAGWLEIGIRMTPKLRGLLIEWFERRTHERMERACNPAAQPPSPVPPPVPQ